MQYSKKVLDYFIKPRNLGEIPNADGESTVGNPKCGDIMKIYYVEDEKDLSEIIRKYLTREGYETTVFHDGESAMEHIDDQVDLWILDIMLTGEVSGYDLIKALKEHNNPAAVIFTSARDQD
ncbi:MAG: response regulator, partial [Candidatus Moranbacteria bacterium]|nr:response regulator [Candidatus Moranbacteria bacterium]